MSLNWGGGPTPRMNLNWEEPSLEDSLQSELSCCGNKGEGTCPLDRQVLHQEEAAGVTVHDLWGGVIRARGLPPAPPPHVLTRRPGRRVQAVGARVHVTCQSPRWAPARSRHCRPDVWGRHLSVLLPKRQTPRERQGFPACLGCTARPQTAATVAHHYYCGFLSCTVGLGLPWGLRRRESACNAGDRGAIPGSGRCPGGGLGTRSSIPACRAPGQRSLGATVHGVAKSRTRLSN